jgi:hypothetical protein
MGYFFVKLRNKTREIQHGDGECHKNKESEKMKRMRQ